MGAYELAALELEVDSFWNIPCPDDLYGSVLFAPNTACEPYWIESPDGAISEELFYEDLPAGSHTFVLMDALGRVDTTTIVVSSPEPLEGAVTVTDASSSTATDGGLSIASIMGGLPPYQISWETGDTSLQLTDLSPGSYEFTLIDQLGCEEVFSYTVGYTNSTHTSRTGWQLSAYPNPFSHELALSIPGGSQSYLVYDLLGRLVEQGPITATQGHIQLGAQWPAGWYQIAIWAEGEWWFLLVEKINP